jgi:hypothetical protein
MASLEIVAEAGVGAPLLPAVAVVVGVAVGGAAAPSPSIKPPASA